MQVVQASDSDEFPHMIHQLTAFRSDRVILDEAQSIKNKTTKSAKAVFELQALTRFCMSGTPMMNNVGELFSLIHFLRIKPYCEYEKFNAVSTQALQPTDLGLTS